MDKQKTDQEVKKEIGQTDGEKKKVISKQPKKGDDLFRYQIILYTKDSNGYVIAANSDKEIEVMKLNPNELQEVLVMKKGGITAPIRDADAKLLNSQSLNTGLFYQKIEK